MSGPTVLVTGGTGYIGSFTTLALLENNYNVVIVDNLHNSSTIPLDRIEALCGRRPHFHNVDIRDEKALSNVFAKYPEIEAVVHFAALKSVGESTHRPLAYYDVNVQGTVILLRCMSAHDVRQIVFSSSATVYGDVTRLEDPNVIPIPEECPRLPTNPYGWSKYMVEQVITDHVAAENRQSDATGHGAVNKLRWRAALLRYFNPCGAHPSGTLGEDPRCGELNLLPVLGHVATGKIEKLTIFGDDYPSHDGTMIRDYVHIQDIASGHLAALSHLRQPLTDVTHATRAWNLGSGSGTTVLEMHAAVSDVVGRQLPYQMVGRREGDVLNLTASPSRAAAELGWKTQRTLKVACRDFWGWISENPEGFGGSGREA